MIKAPVVIFAYNRLTHLKQAIEALQKNDFADQSDLFIFSDGYKNNLESKKQVEEVRKYIKTVIGFKSLTIVEREKNYGLSKNIINGVSDIVNKFGKIIVLEDDLITSPYFLTYMNEALDLYENEEKVISIHGYIYPFKKNIILPETFFIKGADCWGWATWKRGWALFEKDGRKLLNEIVEKKAIKAFNFENSENYLKMLKNQINGKNDSWAVRWYASAFINSKLTLYPSKSLVFYNGSDNTGTNTKKSNFYDTELTYKKIQINNINIEVNINAYKCFISFFRKKNNIFIKYFDYLKNIL